MATKIASLFAEITANTAGLQAGLNQSKGWLDKFGETVGKDVKSLASFTAGALITGVTLNTVVRGVKAAVKETTDYAYQVKDLTRLIGSTTEETSRLIQISDDLNISYSQLSTSMEQAIRKGYAPTIKGLQDIAAAYTAIQDPIERSKFLMDVFGRGGAEMGALMELGAQGIQNYNNAIDKGMILSEDQVDNVTAMDVAIGDLGDQLQGFKVQAVSALAPVVSEFIKLSDGSLLKTITNLFKGINDPSVWGQALYNAFFDGITGGAEKAGGAVSALADIAKGVAAALNTIDTGPLIQAAGLMVDRSATWTIFITMAGIGMNALSALGGAFGGGSSNVTVSPASGAVRRHATGLTNFVVPPGYSNDTYPIRARSGERVDITPASETQVSNDALLAEMQAVRKSIEGLPIYIRDAMLVA